MAKAKIPGEALAFLVKAGRKGGKIGGKARVANMTPQQLSEASRKTVQPRWAKGFRPEGDAMKIIAIHPILCCFVLAICCAPAHGQDTPPARQLPGHARAGGRDRRGCTTAQDHGQRCHGGERSAYDAAHHAAHPSPKAVRILAARAAAASFGRPRISSVVRSSE